MFASVYNGTGAIGAQASDSLEYVANMSADWNEPEVQPFDITDPKSYNGMDVSTVYDSLGRKHTVTQYFVKGPGNEVQVHYAMDGDELKDMSGAGVITELTFDQHGKMTSPTTNPILNLGTPDGAETIQLAFSYTGSTMFAGEMTKSTNKTNGYASGTVTGVALAEDGSIQVQYSNGQKLSVGKLAIATFPNEDALNPVNGSAWQASAGTGDAIYAMAGNGLAGKLEVGALEQSNVDMTSELVNLMGAQQNYQANSKVLSTENEMMRTLMQAL
ncbi:MAG: flagellar hook-basal body complex protein [Rhodanobacter sp.]